MSLDCGDQGSKMLTNYHKEPLTLISECSAMSWFKKYADSRGIAVHYEDSFEKYRGSPSRGSELSQSEITGDEEHHHNNTHNVENIVHVSFSFLSRDRIYR